MIERLRSGTGRAARWGLKRSRVTAGDDPPYRTATGIAANACSKSAIKSSTFSIPTE